MSDLTINQFGNSLVEGHKNSGPRFTTRVLPQGAHAPYERIFSCTYGGRRRFPKGSQAQYPCGLYLDRSGSMSVRHQVSLPFGVGLNPHKEPYNASAFNQTTHAISLPPEQNNALRSRLRRFQRYCTVREGLIMSALDKNLVIENLREDMEAIRNLSWISHHLHYNQGSEIGMDKKYYALLCEIYNRACRVLEWIEEDEVG